MFISIMDTSIVNVALPSIGREFRTPPTAVDGISIAFLVSLAVFIPASGWLGDRFGGKRVLMLAIVVFTVASALCGLASNVGQLVAFRILQGMGGGMLAPVGTAMLFRAFPPQERVRAASIIVLPTALAPALAPVIGGLLITDASWRWVFYVNVPIGIAAFVYGVLFVQQQVESHPGAFDLPGFLLSGIGLALFMYGVSEGPQLGWGSARVLVTAIAGTALLGAMVVVELRTREPIVALRLLGNRLFRSTTGAVVMVSIAFLGTLFAVTLYFQNGRGLSALNAGLSQFPSAIGVMVGSQLASRVVYWRLGPRRHLTLGLIGVAFFIAALASMGANTSLWWARLILFGVGVSMAQVFVPAQAASFATISPADTGRASTLYNASRQLGGAIGVALLTTTIVIVGPVHVVSGHLTPNLTAYRVTFLVAAAIALVGAAAALSIKDVDAEQTMVNPRLSTTGPPAAVAAADSATAVTPLA
ncbi:MAG: multidrug efflux MFS transporter [Actinomycetota bacterium]|nr:multidrug efflux MFS transporter [Actinomycetota bacterium]